MIRPGSIVRPTAGQDQDRYFVVQSVEGCWVQLSDGKKRKLEHPKRKKLCHIQETGAVLEAAVTTNKQLRKALNSLGFVRTR